MNIKKILYRVTLSLSILLSSFCQVVAAQSIDQLEQADKNDDGEIVWQEILDMRLDTFARLDRNTDGFVDEEDSPAFGPMKKRFSRALDRLFEWDANEDKRISQDEMLEAPAPIFESGDKNGDGKLSKEEVEALRKSSE